MEESNASLKNTQAYQIYTKSKRPTISKSCQATNVKDSMLKYWVRLHNFLTHITLWESYQNESGCSIISHSLRS